jgi:hypothetical protein
MKLLTKWQKQIRPDEVFELIKLILDEHKNLPQFCHSKADYDMVLVIATKLFSFPIVLDTTS